MGGLKQCDCVCASGGQVGGIVLGVLQCNDSVNASYVMGGQVGRYRAWGSAMQNACSQYAKCTKYGVLTGPLMGTPGGKFHPSSSFSITRVGG